VIHQQSDGHGGGNRHHDVELERQGVGRHGGAAGHQPGHTGGTVAQQRQAHAQQRQRAGKADAPVHGDHLGQKDAAQRRHCQASQLVTTPPQK
jgi:hypothetical protein